jgi:hypothetical protein
MDINQLTSSKYLKGSDFKEPALCVIADVKKQNVAKDNEPPKYRGVMFFEGHEKGLVLNTTNLKRAAKACNSENTDDWIGKKVVVYFDDEVEFGGEQVGGIRLRAPRQAAPEPEPPKRKENFDDLKDDIPF